MRKIKALYVYRPSICSMKMDTDFRFVDSRYDSRYSGNDFKHPRFYAEKPGKNAKMMKFEISQKPYEVFESFSYLTIWMDEIDDEKAAGLFVSYIANSITNKLKDSQAAMVDMYNQIGHLAEYMNEQLKNFKITGDEDESGKSSQLPPNSNTSK